MTTTPPARSLVAVDDKISFPPFPYDQTIFARLRPDQVPRFLGALTDSDRLPLRTVKLSELIAMQNRVDTAKVLSKAENGGGGHEPTVVQIEEGRLHIADGHHDLAAAWLRGEEEKAVRFKDIAPFSNELKTTMPVAPGTKVRLSEGKQQAGFPFDQIGNDPGTVIASWIVQDGPKVGVTGLAVEWLTPKFSGLVRGMAAEDLVLLKAAPAATPAFPHPASPPTRRSRPLSHGRKSMPNTDGIELKHIVLPFEVKAVSEAGEFEGYCAVFNNIDLGGDMIMPGAFTDSLSEHAKNSTFPLMYFSHEGREIGEWLELREDNIGLWGKGLLWIDGTHPEPDALTAYRGMKKRRSKMGLSIGYRTILSEYDSEKDIRRLEEVRLYEVSPTPMPMNPAARVTDVKSAEGSKITVSALKAMTERELEKAFREGRPLSGDAAKMLVANCQLPALRDAGGDGLKALRSAVADLERAYTR